MTTEDGSGSTPTVVIVGGGAAGIFTAYQINKQWPGQFDIQLFEASPEVGGNVSSLTVEYGGQTYTIDAGAQFFYGNAQPNYLNLIQELGLEDQIELYPTGLTVWEKSTNERLLWVPSTVSGFASYAADDWLRIIQFGEFLVAATLLNREGQPDWTLSVDDWLASLSLITEDFKQNVIKNFLYQFVSLPYASIGEASAVYATTYFVRNVFGGPATPQTASDSTASSESTTASASGIGDIPTFQTNQSLIGLLGVLEKALSASGVSAKANSPVTAVAPGSNGVTVTVNGETINAQYVVMACDPGASATLLAKGGTADQDLITILKGLGDLYLNLGIVMQKDGSCWMPGDQSYWEAVSTLVDTPQQAVSFNAWFGPLRPPYDTNQLIPVFKSWGAPDLQSQSCQSEFFTHVHDVLLPTTNFMQLRSQLGGYQNQNGLIFAGGWTNWFDSQEAALMSAMNAAQMLQPTGEAQQVSQPAAAFDPSALTAQVKSWIEMVAQAAQEPYKSALTLLADGLSA
ncbi:MAG TPA: FAD-dependent oxidoreductase [Pyrinomonadaceae bacterium]|nr:FAD-dependent oxidoreductase [Pyrinomonadaceae bacterium]